MNFDAISPALHRIKLAAEVLSAVDITDSKFSDDQAADYSRALEDMEEAIREFRVWEQNLPVGEALV